jgi:hypothetical protein
LVVVHPTEDLTENQSVQPVEVHESSPTPAKRSR